jgi:GT2 family glycosyltransferase
VPTLGRDRCLLDCLASLDGQTLPGVRVVVVDNSGKAAVARLGAARHRFRLVQNEENAGFGAAVNQGYRLEPAQYLATLNDDAVARPDWLERMVARLDGDPRAGMAAPRILLAGRDAMDSAGLLVAADGSFKQRGHLDAPALWDHSDETLCPSGCAAVYRREMLDQIGLFQEDFFLYCEDADLGLRGRWAGWNCLYVPDAVVEHSYSRSSGAASELKAWLVERNRLRLMVRNFPAWRLALGVPAALVRYFWHLVYIVKGKGKASEFRAAGGSWGTLARILLRAHGGACASGRALLAQRRAIAATRRITAADFSALLRRYSISLREVARL